MENNQNIEVESNTSQNTTNEDKIKNQDEKINRKNNWSKNKIIIIIVFVVAISFIVFSVMNINNDKTKNVKNVEDKTPTSTEENNQNTANDPISNDEIKESSCNILSTVKNEEKKIEEQYSGIPLNDKHVAKLYYYLSEYTHEKNRNNGIDSFTRDEILQLAFTYADYNEDNLQCLESRDKTFNIQEFDITLKGTAYEESLKEIFGSSVKIDYNLPVGNTVVTKEAGKNINAKILASDIKINSYDIEKNEFSILASNYSVGEVIGTAHETKLINVNSNKESITFIEKIAYYNPMFDSKDKQIELYSDESLTNSIGMARITCQNQKCDIDIEHLLDKAKTINYTFKLDKEKNEYYFASSIIN